VDVDADGYITAYEVEHFYEEQAERMEMLCIEHVPFEDVFCQLYVDKVVDRLGLYWRLYWISMFLL
jgi:hypothetical protein